MTETSKQNLAILAITFLLAATVFIFASFIQPTINESKRLSLEIKEEKEKILLLQEYKIKSESLIQSYQSLGDQVNDIHIALPDNPQTAQVLAILDVIAKNTKISFSGLSFTEGIKDDQDYLEIRVRFSSSYEDFKNWLNEIEKELRLIDLVRVNIRPASSQSKQLIMEFNVTLHTYFLSNNF
ncbi:MAG: type 4a pilus biogenesis protein PilO [Candidatus Pacebacteria bacterium]|jgi:Tfp pilus assembly protein PilO|nr:type 4a pilus biogenesis protein PilO [Candidatus Paceibacterota bacterium]MDD4994688.1 type 4a pilus biogenesis protein PilO [Candidatus Paceibacterota bacterium]MDD5535391.1 type 4a pilus biogenesis protein PilO [Candidatus Paceibacterota bacterium]